MKGCEGDFVEECRGAREKILLGGDGKGVVCWVFEEAKRGGVGAMRNNSD